MVTPLRFDPDDERTETLTRTVAIRKLGYSSSPWRLVDSDTGKEVAFETQTLEHPTLGTTDIPVVGYLTKQAAVEALGRLAAQTLNEPEFQPASQLREVI